MNRALSISSGNSTTCQPKAQSVSVRCKQDSDKPAILDYTKCTNFNVCLFYFIFVSCLVNSTKS